MAPTVTMSLTYSTEHFPLYKLKKPLVEKLRRDRINSSIEQLKTLLGQEFLKRYPDSKQEKADILEMTVHVLRQKQQQQQQQQCSSSAAHKSYYKCRQDAATLQSQSEWKTQSQTKLMGQVLHMLPARDQSSKVQHQPSSPVCHMSTSSSKEKNPGDCPALWRPW